MMFDRFTEKILDFIKSSGGVRAPSIGDYINSVVLHISTECGDHDELSRTDVLKTWGYSNADIEYLRNVVGGRVLDFEGKRLSYLVTILIKEGMIKKGMLGYKIVHKEDVKEVA